jgi:hypothetical protein
MTDLSPTIKVGEPAVPAVNVDAETLKYLGYDPASIPTRALVLLAQRYQLDPLLGEIQLINTGQGARLYVTRDGMLAVAHRSQKLDGIVVDEQRRNSTNDGWTCFVSVWRRDMSHPFRFGAQVKDTEPQAKAGNGPEMALARAERRALKRAFQIRTDFFPEHPNSELDDLDGFDPPVDVALEAPATAEGASVQSSGPVHRRAGDWTPTERDQADARSALVNWPVARRVEFLGRHRIDEFDRDWPAEAVAEVLVGSAGGRAGDPAGPAGQRGL